MNTSQKYARCLADGGHVYGAETVVRNFRAAQITLRVCRRCKVPEKPKVRTAGVSGHKQKGGRVTGPL